MTCSRSQSGRILELGWAQHGAVPHLLGTGFPGTQAWLEGGAGYLGVGLLSLPLQEPELLLLLREEAP